MSLVSPRLLAASAATLCLLPALALLGAPAQGAPAAPAPAVEFRREVQPLLARRCLSCHGGPHAMGGLRLDSRAAAIRGGHGGPAFVPGRAAGSRLLRLVTGGEKLVMPPDGPRLTPAEVDTLRRWIDAGAPWSEAAAARPHWSFAPPRRPAVPIPATAAARRWATGPVDAFVAAEHARRGLSPRPDADPATLLRRLYLDLVGLPPAPAELRAFLADPSPAAYRRVVERLLASPQYGERWARHWMDVWRYSDWYGRRAVPDVWNSAPQLWRWRDWIARSLDEDHGYDRMVREMLAADEIAPEDDAAHVATGYLVRNWYALNPNQWMRDNVEHTGKAFLGLTFNCAHCHDHKYDPIRQEDYFRFRAFFEPLQLRQDRVPGEPDPGPFQKYDYAVLRKVVTSGSVRVFDEKLDAQTFLYDGGDERNRRAGHPPVAPGVPAFLGGKLAVEPVELPPAAYYPALKPFVRAEETARRERTLAEARQALVAARERGADTALAAARAAAAESELAAHAARLAADGARYPRPTPEFESLAAAAASAERRAAALAAAERELAAQAAVDAAHAKNDAAALKKAEEQLAAARVARTAAEQALAKRDGQYTPLSPLYPARSSGRRRALAQWIGSRENPLTARVAVNHVWKWHFGRPLVDTVFDFGRSGQAPSHPALLDWLAVELMEHNWSLKHLHRLIVTSRAYRLDSRASDADARSLARDRENRYLWRYGSRRAEAEVVRDSILHAAGELDLQSGGPELDNKQAATSRRRSLYFACYPEEGGHLAFLTLFDPPEPGECYRRTETIMPQQALALTNSALALSQSRILARKLAAETPGAPGTPAAETAFVRAAWERVLARAPSKAEVSECLAFLRRQCFLVRGSPPAPAVGEQIAPAAEPEQRARESLVRALFSHHDFVTLR